MCNRICVFWDTVLSQQVFRRCPRWRQAIIVQGSTPKELPAQRQQSTRRGWRQTASSPGSGSGRKGQLPDWSVFNAPSSEREVGRTQELLAALLGGVGFGPCRQWVSTWLWVCANPGSNPGSSSINVAGYLLSVCFL